MVLPPQQPPDRHLAPQVGECDDAPAYFGSGYAQHGCVGAHVQAREHDALPGGYDLSMHLVPYAERMRVESVAYRRSQADDQLDLRTRDDHARRAARRIVQDNLRHRSSARQGWRKPIAVEARVHAPILVAA